MRAAFYIRVSTDQDTQKLSPEHQLATCREYAEELGLEVDSDRVYSDAGMSGTEMEKRTEVQRMVSDARNGKFDVILFTAISRFARDLSDALALKKRLETVYGIRIISVEEGYDTAVEGRNSEMIFTVHAMVAANKSQEMSKAIRRGLRQSAREGRHIGNITPYGYAKTPDKRLIPDDKAAPIIRQIFDLYLTGLGSKAIAEELNSRGVPTASSANGRAKTMWQASTIVSILKNPVYVGTLVANKWRNDVDIERSRQFDAKIKRQMERPEDDRVVVENNHEPIVDRDTFEAVQQMMSVKGTNRGVRRTSNILSGLMRCSECGGAMIVSGRSTPKASYKYVVCAATRRVGKAACENHATFKYTDVLDAVLTPIQELSASEDKVTDLVQRIMASKENHGLSSRIADLQRQLDRNKQRQREAVRAFTEGLFSIDVVRGHQQELVEEAERLHDELTQLQKQNVNLADLAGKQDEITETVNVLRNIEAYDPVTVRTALATLIDHISFTKDKRLRVYYQWDNTEFMHLNAFLMS